MDPSLVHEKFGPITLAKALKNNVELDGLRECHKRDAAALVSTSFVFLTFLDYLFCLVGGTCTCWGYHSHRSLRG